MLRTNDCSEESVHALVSNFFELTASMFTSVLAVHLCLKILEPIFLVITGHVYYSVKVFP
jgi:hypothetical protein